MRIRMQIHHVISWYKNLFRFQLSEMKQFPSTLKISGSSVEVARKEWHRDSIRAMRKLTRLGRRLKLTFQLRHYFLIPFTPFLPPFTPFHFSSFIATLFWKDPGATSLPCFKMAFWQRDHKVSSSSLRLHYSLDSTNTLFASASLSSLHSTPPLFLPPPQTSLYLVFMVLWNLRSHQKNIRPLPHRSLTSALLFFWRMSKLKALETRNCSRPPLYWKTCTLLVCQALDNFEAPFRPHRTGGNTFIKVGSVDVSTFVRGEDIFEKAGRALTQETSLRATNKDGATTHNTRGPTWK